MASRKGTFVQAEGENEDWRKSLYDGQVSRRGEMLFVLSLAPLRGLR